MSLSSGAAQDRMVSGDEVVLVTGAGGFIGRRVVQRLAESGVRRIRCLVRSAGRAEPFGRLTGPGGESFAAEVVCGNLLSPQVCREAAEGVRVVIHLAAGRGEKHFPDAFLNSVVTTRNLLEACREVAALRRFVNVSSFSVYDVQRMPAGSVLDESAPVEAAPARRGEAYCYAKVMQERLVDDYRTRHGIPSVHLRPGAVYGPGNEGLSARVGLSAFGPFLHLGGSNRIPLTYVDNCAEAIVLAAMTPGIDGEVFNVVDDGLPTSRAFLRAYKRDVTRFRSIYVPKPVSYLLCLAWEKYSAWSQGQLPPAFNRSTWSAAWKPVGYSNSKLKTRLGWSQRVSTPDGLRLHFEACRRKLAHA